mmetsp:Transcript_15041/g.63294  ORF Transcript_15041/g.63294 Transcript_15041/m.63294 type:complete len:210 (+) Transcript_15041:2318-2947(+)
MRSVWRFTRMRTARGCSSTPPRTVFSARRLASRRSSPRESARWELPRRDGAGVPRRLIRWPSGRGPRCAPGRMTAATTTATTTPRPTSTRRRSRPRRLTRRPIATVTRLPLTRRPREGAQSLQSLQSLQRMGHSTRRPRLITTARSSSPPSFTWTNGRFGCGTWTRGARSRTGSRRFGCTWSELWARRSLSARTGLWTTSASRTTRTRW